jgi:hypothetical protein
MPLSVLPLGTWSFVLHTIFYRGMDALLDKALQVINEEANRHYLLSIGADFSI